ncbi:cell division GTPase [Paenibacillus tyrfis]|uniref:cell division GTPase n=1 Tax=Paenibacillus tyrfis TaxID=1501230 RepID=UPI000B58AFA8|nr:cell division GTPase [Paenibacillus tyrfis]
MYPKNDSIVEKAAFIDGIWPLEGFVKQKNAVPSLKYGFIGLGQGGSKIVDAFAGIRSPKDGEPVYPCLIVNSNLGDMIPLKNIPKHLQLSLKGYEQGVGKNPEIGKQAFLDNGKEIFEKTAERMVGCPIIFVVGSMGGGTATGAINVLTDALADYLGIPTASFISLPVPHEVESLNAYNAITELLPKLKDIRQDENGRIYRGLENISILDNQKIFQDHIEDPEFPELKLTWDFYSNYKVASIVHEWNVLTSLESHISLDAADLFNNILLTGGVLTYAKKKINLDETVSKDDLITQIIETYKGKNVLANGFDYQKDMMAMGLVVVMPKERTDMLNQDTLELIRMKFKEELPNVSLYPGFVSHNSRRHAIVYTIASMAGLPERAKNLRQEAEELIRKREEKERNASGFDMGGRLDVSTRPTPRRVGSDNPFATKPSSQTPQVTPTIQQQPKRNPFA